MRSVICFTLTEVTFTVMHSLASALWAQDRHTDAEGTHQRTLEGPMKSVGLTNRITLRSRGGLALVLAAHGKASEDEVLNRRAP
jgi:hypothetical protein